MKERRQFILCYIDKPYAYFTTQTLQDQTGDDWNDAPYQHNAEPPYSPCWHNEPKMRNNPKVKRGYKPGTQIPLETGELCRCATCRRDWNEDGTPKWEILKLAFGGPFETVDRCYPHRHFSVDQINAQTVPWLISKTGGTPSSIWAGTPLPDFCRYIKEAGGKVSRTCRGE